MSLFFLVTFSIFLAIFCLFKIFFLLTLKLFVDYLKINHILYKFETSTAFNVFSCLSQFRILFLAYLKLKRFRSSRFQLVTSTSRTGYNGTTYKLVEKFFIYDFFLLYYCFELFCSFALKGTQLCRLLLVRGKVFCH